MATTAVSLSLFLTSCDINCAVTKKQKGRKVETDTPQNPQPATTQSLCANTATPTVNSRCPLGLARVAVQIR